MPRRRRRGSGKRRPARSSEATRRRETPADERPTQRQSAPDNQSNPHQVLRAVYADAGAAAEVARQRGGISKRMRPPAGLWQVCGCAALCAFGSTAGLLAALHELSYHVARPVHALGYGGVTLCAGGMLGLWLPRRVIRRRLMNGPAAPAVGADRHGPGFGRAGAGTGVELEFAASLAGSLILVLGLTWLLLCLCVSGMESYRAFVVRRFVLPPGVGRAAVLLPACVSLVLVGAVGTTTLVATRGWYRLHAAPGASHRPLWVVMFAAAAACGGVATAVTNASVLILATLLPVFLAGILAVYRKPLGAGTAEPRPLVPGESVGPSPLLVTTTASFSLGLAGVLTFPDESLAVAELGRAATVLAASALLGLLSARACLRWRAGAQLAPLFLLASAAAWTFAHHWRPAPAMEGLVRLAGVGCCASAALSLIGGRLALAYGSSQLAFARVGGLAAAAGSVGVVLGCTLYAHIEVGALSGAVAMIVAAAAGLALVFEPGVNRRLRVGGVLAVAVSLATVTLVSDLEAPAGNPIRRENALRGERPVTRLARVLYERLAVPAVRVRAQHQVTSPASRSAWQIDYGGPRHAVVVVETGATQAGRTSLDRRAGRRLVRRCAAALVRGGHLLIELPADELAAAALDIAHGDGAPKGWGSYLLQLTAGSDSQAVLVIGPGVPEWVHQHPWPQGCEYALYEVPRRAGELRVKN